MSHFEGRQVEDIPSYLEGDEEVFQFYSGS